MLGMDLTLRGSYALVMLPEDKVVRTESLDGGQAVVVHASRPLGPKGKVPCTLLFDGSGALVGIDVDPDGTRTVLMLGRHEDVKSTESTRGEVDGAKVKVSANRALRLA